MNVLKPKARMPRLRMFALAVVLAVLAGGLVISGAAMAQAQVKISSTSPAHNDLNVDPTAPIVITFDGNLNPTQDLLGGVNPRVRISPATGEGGQALGLSATISGNRITITHSVPFEQGRFYQVTVGRIWKENETSNGPDPTLVTSPGPKLQNPWLFFVRDTRAPYVTSHDPADNATNVATNAQIVIRFSEPMDTTTVNVTISPTYNMIASWDASQTVLTLSHASGSTFQGGPTKYTVTVTGQDLSGNSLVPAPTVTDANRIPFSFTTRDTTPPTVVGHVPAAGAFARATDPIVITFSEPINTATFTLPDINGAGGAFQLLVGDQVVKNINWTASFSNENKTVTLQHDAPFQSLPHKVKVLKNVVKDLAGNAIAADYEFTFNVYETTPPVVIDTHPGNGVGLTEKDNSKRFIGTQPVILIFSEPIDPASLKIEFKDAGGTDVGGVSISWNADNTIATIQHDPLKEEDNSVYTLKVLTARDRAGNELVASGALPDKTLTFRTRDLQAPGIVSVDPAHGTLLKPEGTPVGETIKITFTEPVAIDGADAPQISLRYSDGSTPPVINANDATSLGAGTGLYRLDKASAWNADRTQVTLHVDAVGGVRYNAPGAVLAVQVLLVKDDVNKNVGPRGTAAANPWSYDIEDPGPPKLLGVTVTSPSNPAKARSMPWAQDPAMPQDVQLVFRFSKPIQNFAFTDTAAGWVWGTPVFSGDRRVITVSTQTPVNADRVHTISITTAEDYADQNYQDPSNLEPFTFTTGPKPMLMSLWYQRPTAKATDADPNGLKLDGTLGYTGDDPANKRWEWEKIAERVGGVWTQVLDPRYAVVPLNSRLKLEFSAPIDITTFSTPTTQPVVGGWSVTWSGDFKTAYLDHSQLFPSRNLVFTGGFEPTTDRVVNFFIGSANDIKGDPLFDTPGCRFTPIDAVSPSMTVEYQVNVKDDGTWDGDPVWAPLNGASNVPLRTRIRITLNETFNATPVNSAGAQADLTVVGNAWTADEQSGRPDRQVSMAVQSIGARETVDTLVGCRTLVLPVALSGGVLMPDNYEARANYKVSFTARDTRGIRQEGGQWVTGGNIYQYNSTTATVTFTTVDRMKPLVRHVTVGGTSATVINTGAIPEIAMEPNGDISATFTEPVDLASVTISNLGDDSGDITFTGKEISADGKTVTFKHDPAARPASGAPFVYRLQINTGFKDLAGNVQDAVAEEFRVRVPAETTPPQVVSVTATRDTILVEFSEPVIGVTDPANGDANFGYPPSAANPANYKAPLDPAVGIADPGSAPVRAAAVPGRVSYIYYDPTLAPVQGQPNVMAPKGWTVADRAILAVSYNADTRTAILITEPFDKNLTADPDYVEVKIEGIKDLSTNTMAAARRRVTPNVGRHEFDINLAVTTNLPGASVDTHNILGVRDNASDGFGGGEEDILEVLPPLQNFVYLASHHADTESGWQGAGGIYTQDLMKTPTLNQEKVWSKIGISTDLGTAAVPATITLTWDLNVPGREVPFLYSVELLDPEDINGDGLKSYDMRKISSFSFTIATDGILTTRFVGVKVSTPRSVAKTFSSGFNLMSLPVKPINPNPASVFFGLSPLVVYRFEADAQQYEFYPTITRFNAVEPGRGYWIQPRGTTTINVLGTPLAGTQSVKLYPGWNLIGVPFLKPVAGSTLMVKVGDRTMSVAEAVSSGVIDGNILRYDNAQRVYVPSAIAATNLEPWTGYWVLATQAAELLISSPG